MHPRRSRLPSIKNHSGAAAADAEKREEEGEREGERWRTTRRGKNRHAGIISEG
jgi:hypothetical protein